MNERDEQNYSRALFKRLDAEVRFDMICQVTGSSEKFKGVPSRLASDRIMGQSGSALLPESLWPTGQSDGLRVRKGDSAERCSGAARFEFTSDSGKVEQ